MQATSPLDPRVLDTMMPYMMDLYGNPHSRTHTYGWETEKAVDKAREVSIHFRLIMRKGGGGGKGSWRGSSGTY